VVARTFGAAAEHAIGVTGADAFDTGDDRLRARAARARVRRHLVAECQEPRDTRRDAARHHLLHHRAAEAAELPPLPPGHDPLTDRVHAADPRAEDGARAPVDRVVASDGAAKAGILPGLDRREAGIAVVRVHGERFVGIEHRSDAIIDPVGNAGDLAREA